MSIKVEELRVGNCIFLDGGKHKIRRDTFINILRGVSNLKAIPLTDKDVKQYGHFNLIKVNDEYFVCFGNYKTQIKWMHELQNYYYLVNHEEL